MPTKVPLLYLIPVAYLATWSAIFGIWSFINGTAVFEAFGLDLTSPGSTCDNDFVWHNSGARYVGIAAALWISIIWFRTPDSLLTALFGRFITDVLDVVAGLRSGEITNVGLGLVQAFLLFLGPALLGFYLIVRYAKNQANNTSMEEEDNFGVASTSYVKERSDTDAEAIATEGIRESASRENNVSTSN